MKFEKTTLMKTGGWIRIAGQHAAFARVYTNRPGGRAIDPQLEEAFDLLARAGDLKEEVTMLRGALAGMKERALKIQAETFGCIDELDFEKLMTEIQSTLIFCEAIPRS